ncbi:MAG: cytochrome-c peroxidase [Bacteroidota bacterium]
MFFYNKYFTVFFLLSAVFACTVKNADSDTGFLVVIPPGFDSMDVPADNQLTEARITLGKRLFFDPILSGNYSVSCATCHRPEFAFADNKKLSTGASGKEGKANTPSLANVGYIENLMKEGGVHTLEIQVVAPVEEHAEMNLDINEAVERIKKKPVYLWMSFKAYGRKPDHYVVTRALSAFERTLVSGNSVYDRWINNGEGVSAEIKRGKDLFFSDSLACASCHSGFLFTSQEFENNGLYDTFPGNGRERITHTTEDIGKFRVPSLRNVDVTAPYMHDGSLSTLRDVISHYASGGKNHPNKSEKIKGFQLSEGDMQALEAFLLSLTDEDFLKNPNFRVKK